MIFLSSKVKGGKPKISVTFGSWWIFVLKIYKYKLKYFQIATICSLMTWCPSKKFLWHIVHCSLHKKFVNCDIMIPCCKMQTRIFVTVNWILIFNSVDY